MENNTRGPLTRQAGANLRELRKARGLSLSELSERMGALGQPISLNGLSKIELGNRGVDLDDVAALARALGVPPLLLIFPLGREERTEVLPGTAVGTWTGAKWFTGEDYFPTKVSDGGREKWVAAGNDFEDWRDSAPTYFREQDEMFKEWNRARGDARSARIAAMGTSTKERAEENTREAAYYEAIVRNVETMLRRHRAIMRSVGIDPGGLTDNLAHIDVREAADDGQR